MILNGKLVDSTRATLHIWPKSPVPMVQCLLNILRWCRWFILTNWLIFSLLFWYATTPCPGQFFYGQLIFCKISKMTPKSKFDILLWQEICRDYHAILMQNYQITLSKLMFALWSDIHSWKRYYVRCFMFCLWQQGAVILNDSGF